MATVAQCKRALDLHEDELSKNKHVIGLGIVPLDEGRSRGSAVAVYLEKPFRGKKCPVPETLKIPYKKREIEVPTRVIVQGPVSLEAESFELE